MAKLSFRYGSMNSGKTTILIQTAYNYNERNQKVFIIKPKIDTKGNNKIISRVGLELTVDLLSDSNYNFLSLTNELKEKEISAILVDEAQFLTKKQVEELWFIAKNEKIPVLCYGLRTDFQTNSFTGSKRLLELSDELIEMPTICYCGKKARYIGRKVNGNYVYEGDQVVIDGTKNVEYISLCGECYIKEVLKGSNL